MTPDEIVAALRAGTPADTLAAELGVTPRHVRRLARAAGWRPAPREYAGSRKLVILVPAELYRELGPAPEREAARILEAARPSRLARAAEIVADKTPAWACGYLSALAREIGGGR